MEILLDVQHTQQIKHGQPSSLSRIYTAIISGHHSCISIYQNPAVVAWHAYQRHGTPFARAPD